MTLLRFRISITRMPWNQHGYCLPRNCKYHKMWAFEYIRIIWQIRASRSRQVSFSGKKIPSYFSLFYVLCLL